MRARLALLCLTALAFFTAPEPRADAEAAPGYRIELQEIDKSRFPPEITLHFRIVDANGEPARNLPPNDLVVYEEGKEVYRQRRQLRWEPMNVMLVLDASGSMIEPSNKPKTFRDYNGRPPPVRPGQPPPWRTKMDEAKKAADRFFSVFDRTTPLGLVIFDNRILVEVTPGSERARLRRLVEESQPQGGTAIYDACDLAIDHLVRSQLPGKRAIVLMTDGMDGNSRRTNLENVIARAHEHNVKIFSIGVGESEETELRFDDRIVTFHRDLDEKSLRRLGEETGGRYYHVRDAERLSSVFEQVAGSLRSHYSVTFKSTRPTHDGTSRGIRIAYGDIEADFSTTVHGLITPRAQPFVFLGLLAVLGALLYAPMGVRRLYEIYGGTVDGEEPELLPTPVESPPAEQT